MDRSDILIYLHSGTILHSTHRSFPVVAIEGDRRLPVRHIDWDCHIVGSIRTSYGKDVQVADDLLSFYPHIKDALANPLWDD